MVVTNPHIYTAQVMHKRLFPRKNAFSYHVYYLVLPLPAPKIKGLLTSFHPKDLGYRDGSDPTLWARAILEPYDLNALTHRMVLVTMPRVLGYVFNPVSFYFCLDQDDAIRAVLCEVHNTFGEQHTYVCVHEDRRPISSEECLTAQKTFHVSPFLERAGQYQFRFNMHNEKLTIGINFLDEQGNPQLLTSLVGVLTPLTPQSLNQAFWRHPLVTLKAIALIHWQALRLVLKKVRFISKPKQNEQHVTSTLMHSDESARQFLDRDKDT